MTRDVAITEKQFSQGVDAAIAAVRHAPCLVVDAAWSWRLLPQGIELYLDPLATSLPDGSDARLLAYSAGAAAHHARIAFAARGMDTLVYPFPDPHRPRCLARLIAYSGNGTRYTQRLFSAIRQESRYGAAGPGHRLDINSFLPVALAVQGEGSLLTRLSEAQLGVIDAAIKRSARPRMRARARTLVGVGAGTAALVEPDRPATGAWRATDALAVAGEDRRCATYALLSSPADGRGAWFNAGQAWSAARLICADLGLSLTVLPASATAAAAAAIHRDLPRHGRPNFVVRFGRPRASARVSDPDD